MNRHCPLCGTDMAEGSLVTGIGEILWVKPDAKLPSFRIRYSERSTLPDGVFLVQPRHIGKTEVRTDALRCPECGCIVVKPAK